MSAKEFKEKGNEAFRKGQWEISIDYYNRAIALDLQNHILYANRSASYLKAGLHEEALHDAVQCISICSGYHKGYGRKGAAYHAMKEYAKAVAAYKEGLKICPEEPHLLKGLAAAKKAKLDNSKAAKAVQKTEVSQNAVKARSKQAAQAPTVSSFVQQTRMELNLQMIALQAQLDLINELACMTAEEKADLLFGLIDKDGDGTVDARELAAALRKRNADLTFTDSIERAIDMVAVFDKNGDARLDHEEFANFVGVMLEELHVDFHEFAEFLVLQILFHDKAGNTVEEDQIAQAAAAHIDEAVKEREQLFDMLTDTRMIEIFKMLDQDGTRLLAFRDVAICLYSSLTMNNTPTLRLDKTSETMVGVMLMLDRKDSRTLNYEQFGRLVMSLVAAAHTAFDHVADAVLVYLTQFDNDENYERALLDLTIDASAYDDMESQGWSASTHPSGNVAAGDKQDAPDVHVVLAYGRLHKLFDLWDTNGDGDISLQELAVGLEQFQKAAGIDRNAEAEARALLGFDDDGNHALDRREFAQAMMAYAAQFKIDLQELIDFMCVTTVLSTEESTADFHHAYSKSLDQRHMPTVKPAHLEYYEDDDDMAATDDENVFFM